MSEAQAPASPALDIEAIIHAEFAALVPDLKRDLQIFAEARLQEIASQRFDEHAAERQRQVAIFETAVKQSLEARFDTMLSRIDNNHNHYLTQVVGMASTVSGIKTTLDDAEKRRSQQIAAVNENVVKQGAAVQELAGDVAQIKKDLYGVPDQDGQETLFSMIKGIRHQQSEMAGKLEELERDSKDSKTQLQEASAFIASRRTIEGALLRGGTWLWRNKVKGAGLLLLGTAGGGVSVGLLTSIAETVTRIFQP